jgi:hypothetical protein
MTTGRNDRFPQLLPAAASKLSELLQKAVALDEGAGRNGMTAAKAKGTSKRKKGKGTKKRKGKRKGDITDIREGALNGATQFVESQIASAPSILYLATDPCLFSARRSPDDDFTLAKVCRSILLHCACSYSPTRPHVRGVAKSFLLICGAIC